MKESDWKVFVKIKEKALETYCLSVLNESEHIINDKGKSAHERYLALYKEINDSDKTIARIFNGHSRSNAWLQLLAMRKENLADKDMLAKLSEEFLKETAPQSGVSGRW